MPTLTFTFEIGGVPMDVDGVDIEDPTGNIGIENAGTGEVYSTPISNIDRIRRGVYQYVYVPGGSLNLTDVPLDWYAKVYRGGQVMYFPRRTINDVTLPVSAFFSWDEFVRRWGLANIAIASNKDNATKTPNYDAVQDAFDYATDEVNSSQKGGRYAVPLDFSQNAGIVPKKIREWAMVIAFENLYNGRGMDDKNKVGNKVTRQVAAVYTEMSFYAAGLRHLPAALATDSLGHSVTGEIVRLDARTFVPRWYWIGDAPVFSGVYCYG